MVIDAARCQAGRTAWKPCYAPLTPLSAPALVHTAKHTHTWQKHHSFHSQMHTMVHYSLPWVWNTWVSLAADWVVAEDVILSLYSSGSTCLRGLNEITVIQLGPRGTEILPRFLPSPSLSPLGPSQPPGFICACSYTTFIFNNKTRKSHKIIGSISERGSNCLDPVFIFVSSVFHL